MKKILSVLTVIVAIFITIFALFAVYLYKNYETPILTYHSFDKTRIKTFAAVDPEVFYRQMKFIKNHNYEVVLLQDYCKLLKENKPIPRNLIVITADDGYHDNLEAVKIWKKFNYPVTIFLIVDKIGQPGYLSKEEITSFLKDTKVRIGSHTLSHPLLPEISEGQLKREILESKNKLENLFSYNIKTIANQGGEFDGRTLNEVEKLDYLCGCTTNIGSSRKLNSFALRRIKVTNNDSDFTLWAKLSGFYNIFKRPKKAYKY